MSQQPGSVRLNLEDLTDRQILTALMERFDAHASRMEQFMTDLSPEFTDLANAVEAVVAAQQTEQGTIASDLATITDLTAQLSAASANLVTVTAQDSVDAAAAAAAQAQVTDLTAQIAALTTTASASAAAAESAAVTLQGSLPPAPPVDTPTA